MRTEGEIKAAMETLKQMVMEMGNRRHHPDCAMLSGGVAFLGWVIGDGNYNKVGETLLENFRDHLKGKVTRGPNTTSTPKA